MPKLNLNLTQEQVHYAYSAGLFILGMMTLMPNIGLMAFIFAIGATHGMKIWRFEK